MQTINSSSTSLVYAGLVLLLVAVACGSVTSLETEAPSVNTEPPVSTPPPEAATEAPLQISAEDFVSLLEATDPCGLLTKEQVEAGFSKSVQEVKPEAAPLGSECEYVFAENNNLRVTFYDGENASNYFAVLITAGQQSCDEFFNALFDVSFAPLTEKYPSADPALMEAPLDGLYRQYLDVLGECMYVHNEDRADIGEMVVTAETIFLNWSSNVAVLSEDRIIEFTYQEPIPSDVATELQGGTGKEEFYALAEPYRDQVLSGYTEILIGLLQQAISQ
ncbi:MAG: DUF3558 domain-containing protein [Nitrososphaera sp.]|nr:DUF3558 domain-containing protein [Nitrososphaera sp.]